MKVTKRKEMKEQPFKIIIKIYNKKAIDKIYSKEYQFFKMTLYQI
jgi:hypothetical protein